MEPFSTTAVYTTLTKGMSSEKKRKIIRRSMRTSFIVLALFAFTGHLIFQVFGITVPAFQIAGGILLISVAIEMLNPKESQVSPIRDEGIAIVPLAFPLTSGPGSITTVILLVSRAGSLYETLFVPVGVLVGVMLSYVAMTFSSGLFKRFGEDGLRMVTALMAILVLAIAVQFILDGAAGAVRQFANVS
jgi:multiple antibiotic resistance protein